MLPLLLTLLVDAVSVVSANKCFDDGDELRSAITDYIDGDCGNSFSNCEVSETYGSPMNSWCVGNVTDMSYLFSGAYSFNEDISDWDTSSVTTMYRMFSVATSFNGDLNNWDTSSVTTMRYMFHGANSFNGDLNNWNTSSVESMFAMFRDAISFNQDLCAWGDTFPYGKASDIFKGSNCTFEDTPQLGQPGPFCASSCTKESGPTSRPSPAYTVRF